MYSLCVSLISGSLVFGTEDKSRTGNSVVSSIVSFYGNILCSSAFFPRFLSMHNKEIHLRISIFVCALWFFLIRASVSPSFWWVFIPLYYMILLPVMPFFVFQFWSCENFASETPFLQSVCVAIFISDVFFLSHPTREFHSRISSFLFA